MIVLVILLYALAVGAVVKLFTWSRASASEPAHIAVSGYIGVLIRLTVLILAAIFLTQAYL